MVLFSYEIKTQACHHPPMRKPCKKQFVKPFIYQIWICWDTYETFINKITRKYDGELFPIEMGNLGMQSTSCLSILQTLTLYCTVVADQITNICENVLVIVHMNILVNITKYWNFLNSDSQKSGLKI